MLWRQKDSKTNFGDAQTKKEEKEDEMAQIWKGGPVASALNKDTALKVETLKKRGIHPALAIIRVGEKPDDISYENGACRRAEALGIAVFRFCLPADASERDVEETIDMAGEDPAIHGILLLRPLPRHMDEERLVGRIPAQKDVDGVTDLSLAGVFAGKALGFPPCTAQACMEVLRHYGVDCRGKRAVVVGRSLVVGRPVAMLLLGQNATVTICHTKTEDLPARVREGDIVIAAAGQRGMFGRQYFRPGQIVLDVGIHFDGEGKMCGDVLTKEAEELTEAVTPVPGGIGSVTTAVLMSHVAAAAERQETDRKTE